MGAVGRGRIGSGRAAFILCEDDTFIIRADSMASVESHTTALYRSVRAARARVRVCISLLGAHYLDIILPGKHHLNPFSKAITVNQELLNFHLDSRAN